jgi:hypothetical protein
MSVKFERDTFQRTAQNAANGAANAMASGGPIPGTSGKHPFAETVGTALTGGKQNAGTKGYLAVRQSSSSGGQCNGSVMLSLPCQLQHTCCARCAQKES